MKRLAFLLILPLTTFAAAPSSDWSPNVTTGVAWLSNASNGEAVWDRINALKLSLDGLSSSAYELGKNDVLHVTGHLGGDWFPRFYALSQAAVGARVDWQHTFGTDEFAPVFTIEAAGDAVGAGETPRRGIDSAVTLRLAKRFGTGWRGAITERFDDYRAKLGVFDNRSSETGVEIGRDINDATRFVLGGRWRDGDVVTYAQYHRPDLEAVAREFAPLNTFRMPMKAYSATAQTVGGRASLVHATSDSTALILTYEYERSSHTGLRFANSIISLSFVHQY